jgi:hypothetical protein
MIKTIKMEDFIMSTATKTVVKATWPTAKTQAEAARAAASQCAAAIGVLSKLGEQALTDYKAAARKLRVAHLKEQGVKTPLELATAMAEFEANVFGSQIEVSGDEKSATLNYIACAMWDAMVKVTNMTPAEQEQAGKGFQTCMQDLANEFGLKADMQMAEKTCAVTFTK